MATAPSNKLKPERLLDALKKNLPPLEQQALSVAFSGGRDSHVLLHALQQLGVRLKAVHVHHGLSPNADAWASHCQDVCLELHIPLEIHRVSLKPLAQQSIEEEARKARYAVFASLAPTVLALAHHAQDQTETYLLQLFRGAGEAGLAAMAALRPLNENIMLWRPLLEVGTEQIAAYAEHFRLQHIVDESNFDTRYKRNALRQDILPLVETHFPGCASAIARSTKLQQAQLKRIQGLSQLVLSLVAHELPVKLFREHPLAGPDVLRAWLQAQGHRAPDASKINEWTRQLALAYDPERKLAFVHEEVRFEVRKDLLIRIN